MPTPTQEFDIWLFRREQTTKVVKGSQNYEDMLEHIGTFDTVERFWSLYSHIKRPSDLPSVNLSVFRKGIKPLWEDEANKKGGKFGIRVKKGISSHCWEALLLAVVGNQLGVGPDEICGVTISVRTECDIMTLWIRTSDNMTKIQRMKQRIRFLHMRLRLLNLRKSKTSSRVRNSSDKISEESELSSFDENRVMRSAVPRLFKVCIGKNQIT